MIYPIVAILMAAALASGFLLGWWCCHWSGAMSGAALPAGMATSSSHASDGADSSDEEAREEREQSEQRAQAVLQQVSALTASVRAQVGEHNSRVREINDELSQVDGNNIEAVMTSVARLVEANAAMQEQLASAEQKMADQAKQIESHVSEARTDALTGIHNRRAFDEELRRCAEAYENEQEPASVMMLDVDFFKKFNDTHGHKAGDEVLKHVAQAVKASLSSNDVVCRYGGEEFAVIFKGTPLSEAVEAAERAREAIGETEIVFEGKTLQVTASTGLAEFGPNDTCESVMGRADGALYESKKAGRDQGHVHDGGGVKKALSKAKQAKLQARKAAEAERAAGSTAATADSNKSKSAAPAPGAAQRRDERIAAGASGAAGAKEDNLILSGFAGGPKEEAALRDEVTGLPLDRPFYEELTRKLTQWHEGGPGVSIMMVQLDSFNRMRKQHGDEVVNVVLRALAQFLKATVRDADNLARYDEESFAVMLPGVGLDETTAVGLRLEQTVNRCQFTHAGRQVSLSLSIGITQAMSDDNAGRLLLRAKVAKNNAANRGGNQIYLHDGERLRPAAARPGKVAIHDDCRR